MSINIVEFDNVILILEIFYLGDSMIERSEDISREFKRDIPQKVGGYK